MKPGAIIILVIAAVSLAVLLNGCGVLGVHSMTGK